MKIEEKQWLHFFHLLHQEIEDQANSLNDLDRKIGDGDHGINMRRGYSAFYEALKEQKVNHFSEYFSLLGQKLLAKVGGASGPLYGMAFIKGSQILKKHEEFNLEAWKEFVEQAQNTIKALGKASCGEKTMVDIWEPYSLWLQKNYFSKKEQALFLETQLQKIIPLIAKKGRASFLQERSQGFQDPGAVSSVLFINAFSNLLER